MQGSKEGQHAPRARTPSARTERDLRVSCPDALPNLPTSLFQGSPAPESECRGGWHSNGPLPCPLRSWDPRLKLHYSVPTGSTSIRVLSVRVPGRGQVRHSVPPVSARSDSFMPRRLA